ncbi:ABC transporter permease [Arthrobacter sp. KNU-44]|uniref:ABC transporter permease n=1 Tax=Arthrobacter sp. KNU-44 TaxID=3450744 RepID=UPI003F431143
MSTTTLQTNRMSPPAQTPRIGPTLRRFGVLAALLVLVALISIAQPGFLAGGNLMNIVSQWAPVAIMGIGMTYVVITGGFDLSVGAIYSLTAVIAATVGRTEAPIVAFVAAAGAGIAAGAINGWIVTGLKVNPFIATLGSSLIISGTTLVITGNRAVVVSFAPFQELGSGRLAGIPYSGILLLVLLLLAGCILAFTPYGQSVYAVGGNQEASRLAGIRTRGVVASTYTLSGLCAGIAGVVTASQLGSAQPNLNPNLVFDVLTVVIVGGTSLTGGKGAIWRTAVGVGILATLQNGFNLLDIDSYYQNIIKGVIIIAALTRLPRIRPAFRLRRPNSSD